LNNRIYIHYGSSHFDKNLLENSVKYKYTDYKLKNRFFKPEGLWGSPVDTDDWKNWCEAEDFRVDALHIGSFFDKSFKFKLKSTAKILVIKSFNDAIPYIEDLEISYIHDSVRPYFSKLNLEKIYDNFDGMELIHGDNWYELHIESFFNSWDVDSIVIWNPDVIEEIKD